jgi:hypothetical protein
MKTCERCEESARRQAEQMKPREVREGYAVVASTNAFLWRTDPPADIRMGDVVKIELVGSAVEDMGWCECQEE